MEIRRTSAEQAKFNRCVDVMARMIILYESNKAKSANTANGMVTVNSESSMQHIA